MMTGCCRCRQFVTDAFVVASIISTSLGALEPADVMAHGSPW